MQGTWIIWDGAGGELDRFFVPDGQSVQAALVAKLTAAEGGWLDFDAGDAIVFNRGDSEDPPPVERGT